MDSERDGFDIRPVLDYYGIRYSSRNEQMIACPIHGERRPSMSVNLSKGVFNCHSCSAHGGVLDLIAQKEGMDRSGAYEFATAAGILSSEDDGNSRGISGDDVDGVWVSRKARDRTKHKRYVPPWVRG